MNKWIAKLLEWRPVRLFMLMLKRIKLGKQYQVPLYDVLVFFFREITKPDLTMRASAITFSFFLALFPGTLFLFTLIPYIPIADLDVIILDFFSEVMPDSAFEAVKTTISDIVSKQQTGLLSFGILMALYFSTNGLNALMESFNKSYDIFESRSFLYQRGMALLLTLLELAVLVVAVVLILGGSVAIDVLVMYGLIKASYIAVLFRVMEWVIILVLIYIGVSLLYYFGPAVNRRWKFFSIGSVVATLLFVVTSTAFSYYINHFGTYNKLYGSIGTLIVVMLWMNLNSLIILVGFELNAAIYINRSLLIEARQREAVDKIKEADLD
ncbi:MAG: YihY/virulence factor BrkB family protein [Sphingobacteriaceae bacterium]|nr:YihY/virulence factor BrkB family protein [Sphingobacteriaceae bacterium]